MTVLFLSTNFCITSRRYSQSYRDNPVVGSSKMYKVCPKDLFESSVASFTLCASPPDKVVAGCPNLIYPKPTSFMTVNLFTILGMLENKSIAWSTVKFNTSDIECSL